MTIIEMQNEIIQSFGFENKRTIEFFVACEQAKQEEIENLFNQLMNEEEEEDDE